LPEAIGSGPSHTPLPRRHYPEDTRYRGGRPSYSRPSGYYDEHRSSGGTYHASYTSPNYEQSYPSYRGSYGNHIAEGGIVGERINGLMLESVLVLYSGDGQHLTEEERSGVVGKVSGREFVETVETYPNLCLLIMV